MTTEKRSLSEKFMLRLPDGMRERIRLAAEENGRSMNSEILAALEERFPEPSELEALQQELASAIKVYDQLQTLESKQRVLETIMDLQSLIKGAGTEYSMDETNRAVLEDDH